MEILLTTHQMADFAGSEIYTYEVAKSLTRAGHTVTVYSRYIDSFEVLLAKEGIELVTDLEVLKDRHFDIAHVHHHINALEVRHVFPSLPIFFLSHGAKTFLENPPEIDINITQYGAVSNLVAKNLKQHGIQAKKISLVHNIVDDTLFFEREPINQSIKKALIISNRMDEKTASAIKRACQKLSIELTMVGASFKRVDNQELPSLINSADVVFTIGRGVIETMMCGRIPFVFDRRGGDGMLTLRTFKQSSDFHFSGLYRHKLFTTAQILKELKKYDPKIAKKLHQRTAALYSSTVCVAKLEEIYQKTIASYRPKKINREILKYIVNTIHVTRLYTFSRSEEKGFLANVRYFKQDFPRLLRATLSRA